MLMTKMAMALVTLLTTVLLLPMQIKPIQTMTRLVMFVTQIRMVMVF